MKTILSLLLLIPSLSWGKDVLFCYVSGGYDYEDGKKIEGTGLLGSYVGSPHLILKLEPEKESLIEWCVELDDCYTEKDFIAENVLCDNEIEYTDEFIIETSICKTDEGNKKFINTINRYTLEWEGLAFLLKDGEEKKTLRKTYQCELREPLI